MSGLLEIYSALPLEAKTAFGVLTAALVAVSATLLSKPASDDKLIPVIMGMATGNPRYRASQQQALAVAKKCPDCKSLAPILDKIYGNSRIDYRYMAIPDFTPEQQVSVLGCSTVLSVSHTTAFYHSHY
jgi:thiol-disulfide isomerase/thioredoxin